MTEAMQALKSQMLELANHARKQVESWTEGDPEPALLADAGNALGRVSGSARVARVEGVALLADEVRAAIDSMGAEPDGAAMDALADGLTRLTDYLEQLSEGHPDSPWSLRGAMNDLRAARGESELDEAALFGRLLSIRAAANVPFKRHDGTPGDAGAMAKRVYPAVKKALLSLLQGKQVPAALKLLARAVQALEGRAGTPAAFRLWWVTAGFIEALHEQGVALDRDTKRLLGKLERRLSILATKGEQALADDDTESLVNAMLFCVARATSGGERVTALQETFKLDELREVAAEPDTGRRQAVSGRLLRTVGEALQADLVMLRDNLDIFVRTGLQQYDLLESLPAMVRKLHETLEAVGSTDAASLLVEVRERLEAIIDARETGQEAIDGIADRVLRVEDLLQMQLPRSTGRQGVEAALRDTDFAKARHHLVATGLSSLVAVKQSVLEYSELRDAELLGTAPGQLQEFAGTLRIAALEQAADQMDRVAGQLTALRRGTRTDGRALDALAESLVCLELFLEGVRDGASVRAGLITRAAMLLDTLDHAEPAGEDAGAAPAPAPVPPAIEGEPEADMVEVFLEEAGEQCDAARQYLESLRADPADGDALSGLRRAFHTLKGSGRMVGATRVGAFSWAFEQMLNRYLEAPGTLDADVIELAAEGIATVPALIEQVESGVAPDIDAEALAARATAAARGGAVAPPSRAETGPAPGAGTLDAAVRHAQGLLGNWLDAVEQGRATGSAPAPVMEALSALSTAAGTLGRDGIASRAQALRGDLIGLQDIDADTAAGLRGQAAALDTGAGDGEPDGEMAGVFVDEADDLLAQLTESFKAWEQDTEDDDALGAMQRYLHTLKGGARTSGLAALGDLAHALETLLLRRPAGAAGRGLVELMQRGLDRLFALLEDAGAGRPSSPPDDLLADITALVKAAPDDDDGAARKDEPAGSDRRNRPRIRYELARVRTDLLDHALNNAAEVSIYRLRLEQQVRGFTGNLIELKQTIERLREQLRKQEIETEAQIVFQHTRDGAEQSEFDPLELDRYSQMQQLSRALMESISDLSSLHGSLEQAITETEGLLLHQSRAAAELQDGLMGTRMVPLHTNAERMRRVVRQAAADADRKVELRLDGADVELDRPVLDRLMGPLEHILRNAVVHGIEPPDLRTAAGKPDNGLIVVSLSRDASEMVLSVRDDGAGLDFDAIREKAGKLGLIAPGEAVEESRLAKFVLRAGLSTAAGVTQAAGRGVGLDVVNSEIDAMGGTLDIRSTPGQGVEFTFRLPFTMSATQAMMTECGKERYAVPLPMIDGIVRLAPDELERLLAQAHPTLEYGGETWELLHLGGMLSRGPLKMPADGSRIPALLVVAGTRRSALLVDEVSGSSEMVVKSLGPHLGRIPGLSGATIMGDGRVVLILDVIRLVKDAGDEARPSIERAPAADEGDPDAIHVLVVDDSITVRRVTRRLLERRRMQVHTARDGIEAMEVLQERIPDVVLLDIEMPRMDGFELAEWMRAEARLKSVPIVMITSRSGEKHRNRAKSIGIDHYLGKPYQELELLNAIQGLIDKEIKMTETQYPKDTV